MGAYNNLIKLHLGCGVRDFGPDWVHIDGAQYPHNRWHDVTKLRYEDNNVSLIYASHLIAYFDRTEIVPILKEWYRVLKPGGILRLATPDAEALCDVYKYKTGLESVLGPLYGKMQLGDKTIYHKTVYDLADLMEVLSNVGFTNIHQYDHRLTDHPNTGDRSDKYDDCSAAHINGTLISLNVEATKP